MTDPRQYHWYQPCVQCTGVSGAEPEGVGEGVELCADPVFYILCNITSRHATSHKMEKTKFVVFLLVFAAL